MFEELLARIALALDRQAIPYMIIGGQAVLRYGEPRATKDIDVTLGAGISELDAVRRALADMGLEPLVEDVGDFARRTMVVPAIDRPSGIRVDLILSFSPYEKQALARAQGVNLGGTKVRFASLEDVVIHKIVAGRPRDLEDVRSILLKNPGFDGDYILRWLREFQSVADDDLIARFGKLRADAGL